MDVSSRQRFNSGYRSEILFIFGRYWLKTQKPQQQNNDQLKKPNGCPFLYHFFNTAASYKQEETMSNNNDITDFLSQLALEVPPFVKAIEDHLAHAHNLDVSDYQADHVCWRTETWDEYTGLVEGLKKASDKCRLLIESKIGGRPIATFWLQHGIVIPPRKNSNTTASTDNNDSGVQDRQRILHVLEIPAPKQGRSYRQGLEHVEFVIGNEDDCGSSSTISQSCNNNQTSRMPLSPINDNLQHEPILKAFMSKYPTIPWDTKAMAKSINPDVSIKVELKSFGSCSVKFHLYSLDTVIQYEKEHGVPTNA